MWGNDILSREICESLHEAKVLFDPCRRNCRTERLHSELKCLLPTEYDQSVEAKSSSFRPIHTATT